MTFDEKWRGEIVSEVEKRLIVDAQWNEYQVCLSLTGLLNNPIKVHV